MCLLNFKENIYEKPNNEKNYMNIKEIKEFIYKIKEINIFDRKNFVTQLFENININEQINNLNEELTFEKFQKSRKFIEINKNKDIKYRKGSFIESLKNELDDKTIVNYYLEIVKLLAIDNTNEKLLEIYLLFLQLYEKYLIGNFGINNIEKYEDEVKYYSVCFSKDEYKELFDLDKITEKESLLNFLNETNEFDNFNYDNLGFNGYIQNFKQKIKKIS